jgi:hypothetical protein
MTGAHCGLPKNRLDCASRPTSLGTSESTRAVCAPITSPEQVAESRGAAGSSQAGISSWVAFIGTMLRIRLTQSVCGQAHGDRLATRRIRGRCYCFVTGS